MYIHFEQSVRYCIAYQRRVEIACSCKCGEFSPVKAFVAWKPASCILLPRQACAPTIELSWQEETAWARPQVTSILACRSPLLCHVQLWVASDAHLPCSQRAGGPWDGTQSSTRCTHWGHSHVSRPARECRPWWAREGRKLSRWDLLSPSERGPPLQLGSQHPPRLRLRRSSGVRCGLICCSLCFASLLFLKLKRNRSLSWGSVRALNLLDPPQRPKHKKPPSVVLWTTGKARETSGKRQLQTMSWVAWKGRGQDKNRAHCSQPLRGRPHRPYQLTMSFPRLS